MSYKDHLPGGLADDKKPQDFDPKQLAKGIKVEMEHVNDRNLAQEIAMDHLMEDSKYYDHLVEMENKMATKTKKRKATPDEGSGHNLNSPVKLFSTHPNRRFALGDMVLMIDPEEPNVLGKVLGHVAEDRVWVQWPTTASQEDVEDLIATHEWSFGPRSSYGSQLERDQDKTTASRKAFGPFNQWNPFNNPKSQFQKSPSTYNPLRQPQVIKYLENVGLNKQDVDYFAGEYDRVLRGRSNVKNKAWEQAIQGKPPEGFNPDQMKTNFGDATRNAPKYLQDLKSLQKNQRKKSPVVEPQPQLPPGLPMGKAVTPAYDKPAVSPPMQQNAPKSPQDILTLMKDHFDQNNVPPEQRQQLAQQMWQTLQGQGSATPPGQASTLTDNSEYTLADAPKADDYTLEPAPTGPKFEHQPIKWAALSEKRKAAIASLETHAMLLEGLGDVHAAMAVMGSAKVASAINTLFENPKTRSASYDEVSTQAWKNSVKATLAFTDILRIQNRPGRNQIAERVDVALLDALTYPR